MAGLIELGVQPIKAGAQLEEEAAVAVTVRIDDANGKPMPGVVPAAWMSLRHRNDRRPDAARCTEKIATFTAGNVFVRPEVDLNVFHVLALNDDATITVIDPHFGFGGSRLLAMIELRSRGEDWTFNADSSLLYRLPPYSLFEQRTIAREYHFEGGFIFACWICNSEEPRRVDQWSLPMIESFRVEVG